jgi:hypothetical protein
MNEITTNAAIDTSEPGESHLKDASTVSIEIDFVRDDQINTQKDEVFSDSDCQWW